MSSSTSLTGAELLNIVENAKVNTLIILPGIKLTLKKELRFDKSVCIKGVSGSCLVLEKAI